jgi:hypothetical protein
MAATLPMAVGKGGGTFLRIAETPARAAKNGRSEAYHEKMKLHRILIAAASLAWASGAFGADFRGVKTVYLLPMSNGLDQYLAVRLTAGEILQVVTDPQKADAVFTDHVGETFEKNLDDLYGAAQKADENNSTESFARVGGSQRSKGTFFLVERKTRDVVWSDEESPKGTSATEMRRIADRVSTRLSKAIKGK